ncbi:MAG: zinc ribbon domain-containing protein [Nitrospiria bacterium]
MKEELALLVRLQTMDIKRQKSREVLDSFPEKMAIAEKPLLDARAELEEARQSLEALHQARKDQELALQVIEDKIVKLKLRLTDLKTNKEYHAHLQEIAAARNSKNEIEDQLITGMEDAESLTNEIAEKEAVLTKDEAAFSEIKNTMQAEMDEVASTAAAVEAEWKRTSEKISKNLLASYQRLFASSKGLAVVPVNGFTCTGCHFSLPPQLIAEVKRQEKVLTCGYCHRILYAIPPEKTEKPKT